MNVFLTILLILFSVFVCLTVHELGHFIFAKIFKVNVKEFSIGLGPILLSIYLKKNNIRVSLRLLPIGAFVLLDSLFLRKTYLSEPNSKKYNFYLRILPYGTVLFDQIKYWKQFIIMFGGILFNFVAFGLFLSIWMLYQPNAILDFINFIKNIFINIGHALIFYNLWHDISDSSPNFGTLNLEFLLRYLLSINLATAILNLIPIPPLDGWKIMQIFYEKITKKKLPEILLGILSIIGSIFILWITIGSIVNLSI